MSSAYRFALHWTLFLRVSKPPAAEKLLRRLSAKIGREVTPYLMERYWKLPELYRVQATTLLDAERIELAIFEALVTCRDIGVSVTAPSETGDGWWSASGSGTGKGHAIPGVETVWFDLRNYDYPREPNVTGRPMPQYDTRDVVQVTAPLPEHADLLGRTGVVSVGIGVGANGWGHSVHLYGEANSRYFQETELSPTGRRHPEDPEGNEVLVEPVLADPNDAARDD